MRRSRRLRCVLCFRGALASGGILRKFDNPKNASTAASAVSMPAFFFMIVFSLVDLSYSLLVQRRPRPSAEQ